MRTAPHLPTPPTGENEKIIFDELMAARAANRPISRNMLSQKLHEAKGLHPKQAFALVDMYCDNEAPSTPDFLSKEFMVPYLKISAFVMAALSLGVLWFSIEQVRHAKNVWVWGVVAAVFLFGMSLSGWIKSLWREFVKDD